MWHVCATKVLLSREFHHTFLVFDRLACPENAAALEFLPKQLSVGIIGMETRPIGLPGRMTQDGSIPLESLIEFIDARPAQVAGRVLFFEHICLANRDMERFL